MVRAGGATSIGTWTDVELSLLSLINEARRDHHGLRPLKPSRALARAAAGHARAMARLGFFAHESADGTAARARIRRAYDGSQVAETLLWRSPDVTPEAALRMWLQSPGHRRILLGGSFRDIGLSAVHATGAPGAFGGRDVTIVVADFGAP
jgi:uncharacterized protein YkwD